MSNQLTRDEVEAAVRASFFTSDRWRLEKFDAIDWDALTDKLNKLLEREFVPGAHMGTNQGPGQAGIPPEPVALPEEGKT